MTPEELQKRYDRLINKVRQMRGLQREYARWRAKVDWEKSRRLEREVDALIEEEVKRMKSNQKEMF